jgi:hypothetical protein
MEGLHHTKTKHRRIASNKDKDGQSASQRQESREEEVRSNRRKK